MCFSATASFAATAVTGVIGVIALRRATGWREAPFASIPLVFAAQQACEGLLWRVLPVAPRGAAASALTLTFLAFALVIWPVLAPLAMLLIEPVPRRRVAMGFCVAAGVFVAGFLLWGLVTGTNEASIAGRHIAYVRNVPRLPVIDPLYLVATGLAPALSSHRAARALAIVVLIGSVIAFLAYHEAFVSVWCFFAAVASVIVLAHVSRVRKSAP